MPEEDARPEKPEPSPPARPEPVQPAAKAEPLAQPASETQPPQPPEEHLPETPQEPAETAQTFPSPYDQDIEYEIVEPPEDEESDDGFASIPPGPTEEVCFEPERVRRPRRGGRRGAPRREPEPAATAAEPQRGRFPVWKAVAAAILAVLIFVAVALYFAYVDR